MNFIGKTVRTCAAATLLLAGIATATQGDGSSSFAPPGPRGVRVRGAVVRAGCTLEGVRSVRCDAVDLYQPRYTGSRAVLGAPWSGNTAPWQQVVWPSRLWLHGKEQLLQRFTAEATLNTGVEIKTMLDNTRTLDITRITLSG